MKHLFIASIFLLSFAILSFGQEENHEVVLPDEVMGQIVHDIVKASIKPPEQSQLVYFANRGLRTEWLPEIENVSYVWLDYIGGKGYGREVYFFTQIEKKDETYSIVFAFGDPACSANGETWTFSIVDSKVKDLKQKWGWGAAC